MLGVLELQVLELLAELPRLQVATEEAEEGDPRSGLGAPLKGSLKGSIRDTIRGSGPQET